MSEVWSALATVDLDAYRYNIGALGEAAGGAELMAVVKADGYGHGMVECARAAREAGATWLGVATLAEARALRGVGDRGRLLCWLATPGEDFGPAIAADVDVTASSVAQLEEVETAARRLGRRARVQLKADTGLSRNGALPAEWDALVTTAAAAQRAGHLRVTGLWSHFACADEPDHPSLAAQEEAFTGAVERARAAGLEPEVCHLANSAATLTRPSAHLDLVRVGIASYGLSPAPALGTAADLGLRPVMTLRARLAGVKRVPGGSGVSYGHTFVTESETTLGLVPLGYGDGILRSASNRASVWAAGGHRRIAGRVCMDQFVIDLGDASAERGDEVVLFGSGAAAGSTAETWAEAAGTISYEVVTRLGGRIRRIHTGL